MQLVAALLFLDAATARVGVYTDDDDLTVVSPQALATIHVASGVEADAGWTADVISAATVDVRTAATPRGSYRETRHEGHVGPRWEIRPGTVASGGYTFSTEPDYTGHAVSVGLAHDLFRRRLTVAGVFRLLSDRVGRAEEPSFREDLDGLGGELSASVVVDRRTVVAITSWTQRMDGFQASPYRRVEITDEGGRPRASLTERTPRERWRQAWALSARRALPARLYATGLYRFYSDTWGVRSHTGELEMVRSFLDDRVSLGVRLRGYAQGAADFYEREYRTFPELPALRTADKKLGANRSLLAGLRGDWAPGGPRAPSRLEASFDVYDQWFVDFAPLRRRRAALVAIGWSAEW